MDIILPIKQNPFDRIFSYKKHYEFRKKVPKETTGVYLYLSKIGIVAYLTIGKVIEADSNYLSKLAELTEIGTGKAVKKYLGEKGVALEIIDRKRIDKIEIPFVPQSFCYADRFINHV